MKPIQTLSLLSLALILSAQSAQATASLSLNFQSLIQSIEDDSSSSDQEDRYRLHDLRYRVGSQWGKVPVRANEVDGLDTPLSRLARATARVRYSGTANGTEELQTLATAWYAGKFIGANGQATHVMATNYHVARDMNPRNCRLGNGSNTYFEFTMNSSLSNQILECDRVIGRWSEIDFALIALKPVSDATEARLNGVGLNFAWKPSISHGQSLLTVGFGMGKNDESLMMKNEDSDCRVFSQTDEFRLLFDPDTINPSDYGAWSFAHGCDISHGDSGSAFADRTTGKLLGIVWTAGTSRAGRPEWVQDSAALNYLLGLSASMPPQYSSREMPNRPYPEAIWGVFNGSRYTTQAQLGYSVPAAKIQEHLLKLLRSELQKSGSALKETSSSDQVLIAHFLSLSKSGR